VRRRLNEGFATLFSYLCTDDVYRQRDPTTPAADAVSLFHVHINPLNEAIGASSGPHQNALRSQAHSSSALSHSASFGTVAYAKAGATLAMAMDTMERTLPGSFRRGLGFYLRQVRSGQRVLSESITALKTRTFPIHGHATGRMHWAARYRRTCGVTWGEQWAVRNLLRGCLRGLRIQVKPSKHPTALVLHGSYSYPC
jgi:hypothetical protein